MELDKDMYLWIIWYVWKLAMKLLRGISRDSLELIRHAQSDVMHGMMQTQRAQKNLTC